MGTLSRCVLRGAMLAATAQGAGAGEVAYRFVAEPAGHYLSPPPDSAAARASAVSRITGTVRFSPDAGLIGEAGIPGQVAFALYATGSISLDDVELGAPARPATLRVTDGVARIDDPKRSFDDELAIGLEAARDGGAVDYLSMTFDYGTADALDGTAIPSTPDAGGFASITLVFSHGVSGPRQQGDRTSGTGGTGAGEPAAAVVFRVVEIEPLP